MQKRQTIIDTQQAGGPAAGRLGPSPQKVQDPGVPSYEGHPGPGHNFKSDSGPEGTPTPGQK